MGVDFFGVRGFLDVLLRLGTFLIILLLTTGKFEEEIFIPAPFGVGLWLGWAIISSFVAGVAGRSVFVSLQRVEVYFFLVAVAIAVASLARSGQERKKVIEVLLAAGLLSAMYGLWQYFAGFERTAEQVAIYGAGSLMDAQDAIKVLARKRIFSTTISPDIFAGLMAALAPLSLAYIFNAVKEKDKRSLIIGVIAFIVCLSALYFAGSLGGWLAAFAGFLVLIFIFFGRGRKAVIALVFLIALSVVAEWGIISRRSETFRNFQHPNNPVVQRLNYWGGGIKLLASNPVMGVGPANYGNAYLTIKPEKASATRFAHNAFVQYLAEIGAPGAAGFILVVFAFLLSALKQRGEDAFSAGILASGCAFLAHSMIDYDTEIIEVAVIFWVMFGMAVQGKKVEIKKARILRPVILALTSILIFLHLWSAIGAYYMEAARQNMVAGKFGAAVGAIRRAQWLRGFDPAEARLQGKIFSTNPRTASEAESAFKRLVAVDSLDPSGWMDLGNFYIGSGDYARAMNTFDKAAQIYPSFPAARALAGFCRAHVLIRQGDIDGARRELKKVLVDFPNHKGALEGLNYISQLEKAPGR